MYLHFVVYVYMFPFDKMINDNEMLIFQLTGRIYQKTFRYLITNIDWITWTDDMMSFSTPFRKKPVTVNNHPKLHYFKTGQRGEK